MREECTTSRGSLEFCIFVGGHFGRSGTEGHGVPDIRTLK